MVQHRAFSAIEQANLNRAGELIDEAARHHGDAMTAHGKGEDRALAAAHRSLGNCLRAAQRCLRDLAAASAAADIANTQNVQTSSGGEPSIGSLDGRASAPLYGGDDAWLARAFGARRRA
jgi:hypothetical protein